MHGPSGTKQHTEINLSRRRNHAFIEHHSSFLG
jgi:hypothetical protein